MQNVVISFDMLQNIRSRWSLIFMKNGPKIIYPKGIPKTMKKQSDFWNKKSSKIAHGAPNDRKGALEHSAGGAIWRRRVPTNEKNDRLY